MASSSAASRSAPSWPTYPARRAQEGRAADVSPFTLPQVLPPGAWLRIERLIAQLGTSAIYQGWALDAGGRFAVDVERAGKVQRFSGPSLIAALDLALRETANA